MYFMHFRAIKDLGPLLAKHHMLTANDASYCRNRRLKKKLIKIWKINISKFEGLSDHKAKQNKSHYKTLQ